LFSDTMARASATRCRCPPESSCGLCSSRCVSPTSSATRSSRFFRSGAGSRRTLSPNTMFSFTVRCGNSAYDWNTIEILRFVGSSAVTSRPSMKIVPSLTSSSPATSLSRVDFPQPDGPSSTTNFPDSARKLTSSTAVTRPKRFVTFFRTISDNASPRGAVTELERTDPIMPSRYPADLGQNRIPATDQEPSDGRHPRQHCRPAARLSAVA
jgi:hypothetical protein